MEIIKTKNFEIAVNKTGDSSSSKVALLLPGRLDTKDYVNFASHGEYLAQKGFLTYAFDPPGTWDSPGDLASYTTTMYLQVVNELIDYTGNKPTLLLGHSRGGATAMLASANPAVAGLVLVNAAYGNPSAPKLEDVMNGLLREKRDLPPGNVRTEEKRIFDLPMNYFEDGATHDPVSALRNFKGSKLIVHAIDDEFTPYEKVREIFNSLDEPKEFLELKCTHDYRLSTEAIETVNVILGKFINYFNET